MYKTMNKDQLKQKASKSDGLSQRCSACCFRKAMVGSDMKVSEICKTCSKAYREGYEKGYKACRRNVGRNITENDNEK